MLVVKESFEWHRTCSCIPNNSITVEAGAPVHIVHGDYYVHPEYFNGHAIEKHDATFYGCYVSPNNVEEVI